MEWIKKQERILERQYKNSSQRLEAGMQGIGNLLMTPNKVAFSIKYPLETSDNEALSLYRRFRWTEKYYVTINGSGSPLYYQAKPLIVA
jgi:hypothetical protein